MLCNTTSYFKLNFLRYAVQGIFPGTDLETKSVNLYNPLRREPLCRSQCKYSYKEVNMQSCLQAREIVDGKVLALHTADLGLITSTSHGT